MATRKKERPMVAGNETTLPLAPCGTCNGIDCGTPRIRQCCDGCTHT
jgi:hypothetical protein